MKQVTRGAMGMAGLSLVIVVSCTRVQPTGDQLVAMCQAEVAPAGSYEYDEGEVLPKVRPVADGTEAGADAFNRCIRLKAAEAGMISLSSNGRVSAACPEGAATIYGGATYCIGNN